MTRCTQATATAQFVSTDIQQQRQSRFVNKSSSFLSEIFSEAAEFFFDNRSRFNFGENFFDWKVDTEFFHKKI